MHQPDVLGDPDRQIERHELGEHVALDLGEDALDLGEEVALDLGKKEFSATKIMISDQGRVDALSDQDRRKLVALDLGENFDELSDQDLGGQVELGLGEQIVPDLGENEFSAAKIRASRSNSVCASRSY